MLLEGVVFFPFLFLLDGISTKCFLVILGLTINRQRESR